MNNEVNIKAYRVIAKGRVQGVGFRYWTNALAKRLGVKGAVRNCSDYSVEIIAETDKSTFEEFIYELNNQTL